MKKLLLNLIIAKLLQLVFWSARQINVKLAEPESY